MGVEKEALNRELGSRSRLQGQRGIAGKRKRHLKFSSSTPLLQVLPYCRKNRAGIKVLQRKVKLSVKLLLKQSSC